MKKLILSLLLILNFSSLYAQDYSQAPKVGVPANTECLSLGNNNVCNQYRPAGPDAVTNTYSIPTYTGIQSPQNVLAPVDSLNSYFILKNNYVSNKFSLIGDSRTANLYVTTSVQGGTSGLNWFNQANALANQRYILGTNAGLSGCRTDQYLQDVNFNKILNDNSLNVAFNFPAVNDFGAAGNTCSIQPLAVAGFPYVNTNGVTVTTTNVGQVAADNIIKRAKQIIAQGRNVILVAEPGQTSESQAIVGQLYDFNAREQAFCLVTPRCFFVSLNSSLWNPTGSATANSYISGVLVDGTTHYSVLGGYLAGVAFNTWYQNIVPGNANLLLSSINDVTTTNPRQIGANPLFQVQTGGTNNAGTCVLTGAVPANWTLICGVGTTAVTLTYVADPSGFGGSCVQLAMTTSGADTVRIRNNGAATSTWNLTDWFQSSAVVSVANGSSKLRVYGNTAITTDAGVANSWSLYGGDTPTGGGANDGPTTAYTYTLLTAPAQALTGSTTKTSVVGQIYNQFSAAGSGTTTICRPSLNRLYNYDAVAGFTGQ